ncbi:Mitochondrial substrate carrier protein [Klebsormidium nitens]|uniref:Mitochondrial substrate carrier protein n=1 Tax=Klebsormidium nitens TaxID=105231 RepID=A0A0U9I740_KLENI|nr:Mitochondrial substrate carrier protein [Klebsormidium nitens]|eukprot:GAQ81981.1 Mitochondrial substrate carrier protein [Klebsormidium nitens]
MGDAFKDYAAGIAAGIATVLIGHPFDTIKVNLQAKDANKRHGPLHVTSNIVRRDGVRGLYRGASSSFLGVAAESSVLFGCYSQIKGMLHPSKEGDAPYSAIIPAAAVAGASVSLILCPTELVKCRLQMQDRESRAGGQRKYNGPFDCVSKTFKQEGLRGFYRGLSATAIRESLGNVCFFTTYEVIRKYMTKVLGGRPVGAPRVGTHSEPDSYLAMAGQTIKDIAVEGTTGIVSGGVAGIVFWAIVLPFDVMKTRMQTEQAVGAAKHGFFSTFHMIRKESGISGLYAGLSPTLVRAFPANAAAIVAWELAARALYENRA